jgi:hypothetical protein
MREGHKYMSFLFVLHLPTFLDQIQNPFLTIFSLAYCEETRAFNCPYGATLTGVVES